MFDLPLCLKKRGGPFAIVWTFGTDKKALQRFNEEDVLKVDLKNITLRIIECIPVFTHSQTNAFKPETMLSLAAIAKMILGCCRINLYHNNKIILNAERYLQNLEDPRELTISPFESEIEDVRGMSADELMPEMEPILHPNLDDVFDEMEGLPMSPQIDDSYIGNFVIGKNPRVLKKNPKRNCRNRTKSIDSDDDLEQPKRKRRAPRKPKLATVPEEPLNNNTTAVDNITTAGVPTIAPLIEDVENVVYADGNDLEALDIEELVNFNDSDFVRHLPLAAHVHTAANLFHETTDVMMQHDETIITGNVMHDEPIVFDASFKPDAGAAEEHILFQTDVDAHEIIYMSSPERVATFLPHEQTDANMAVVIMHQPNDNTVTFFESRLDGTNEVETARRMRASSVASATAELTNVVSEPTKTFNITSNIEEVPQLNYTTERSVSSESMGREQLLTMRKSVSTEFSSVDDQNVVFHVTSDLNEQTDGDQSMFIAYETNTSRKRRVLKPRTKKDPRTAKIDRDKRCWMKIRKNAVQLIQKLKLRDSNRDYEKELEFEEGFQLMSVSDSRSLRATESPQFQMFVYQPGEETPEVLPTNDNELFIEPAAEFPPVDHMQPLSNTFNDVNVKSSPFDKTYSVQPLTPLSSRPASVDAVFSHASSPVSPSQNLTSQDLFTSQMSESEDSEVGLLPGATYFLADHLKDIPTEFKFAEVDVEDEPSVINFSEEDIFEVLLSYSYAKKKILFNFKELFGHFDIHLKAFMFQSLTLLAGKERLIILPCEEEDDLQFCLSPDAIYLKGMKKLLNHIKKTGWTPNVVVA